MGEKTTVKARDARLDVARGVSIAAVVIVHVFRGLYSAGTVDGELSSDVDQAFGIWCLAVFVFITGTFLPRGAQRRGPMGYVRDRAVQFLFVYVVWTLLQGGVQLLAASAVNTPISPTSLVELWRPIGHLWYLPFLVLAIAVFVPIRPWELRHAPWALGLAAVISFPFWGSDFGYVGTQGLGLIVFLVLGMVLGEARVRAALDRFSPLSAGTLAAVILVGGGAVAVVWGATAPTFGWTGRTAGTVIAGIVLAFVTLFGALLLGQAARGSALLAMLGRRSLEIYLAHIIFASGARIALSKLGVTDVWVSATVCFLVGVAGPVLLAIAARRVGLGWIYDAPAWFFRNSAPRPADTRSKPDPGSRPRASGGE